MLDHLPAIIANGWTAYSFAATLTGGAGLGLIALAFLATAWLPGFIRRPLIAAGLALVVGAALYQAGQAKGAADAFELDAARALAAEAERADAAEKITADLAAAATRDLADEQARSAHLKDLLHDAEKRADAARVCLPRDLSRRLRAL